MTILAGTPAGAVCTAHGYIWKNVAQALSLKGRLYVHHYPWCLKDIEELAAKLHTSFSISMDEATNNANDKVCNVLVRYYDEEQECILTQHCFPRIEGS